MKKIKIPVLGILFLVFVVIITSCTNNEDNIEGLKSELTDKQQLLKETSILFGKLLTDKEVKNHILFKMKQIEQDGNIVSFAYLLNEKVKLKKNEIQAIQLQKSSKASKNIFKNALIKEFQNNQELYSSISNSIEYENTVNKLESSDIADDLAKLLVDEELQIFYPYDEDFENNAVNKYYVSYDPLDGSKTNEGFQFTTNTSDYIVKENLNNDFLDENPVFLIVPIDDCDLPGRPCDFEDLDPIADLPPYTGGPKLLTYNVNHNLIPEKDIISSKIPYIRVNGTRWMGFAGTHQKLKFFRGSPSGTVAMSGGFLVADADSYPVKYIRAKRRYVKRSNWLAFDAEFDPDWNMTENTQAMAVFSIHHWRGSAETEVTVKSGYKFEDGEFKPTAEATVSTKVKIEVDDDSVFRDKIELSRRLFLATIIGEGISGKTIHSHESSYNGPDNDIDYNLKSIGIIDYYIKYWHTDLTP